MERKLQFNPITFPLWWYTIGLGLVWHWIMQQLRYGLKTTGLLLFVRHLRQPLYGDYTRSGRIISFFLRLVLLGIKLFFLGIRLLFVTVLLVFYLAILPFSMFMVVYMIVPI